MPRIFDNAERPPTISQAFATGVFFIMTHSIRLRLMYFNRNCLISFPCDLLGNA